METINLSKEKNSILVSGEKYRVCLISRIAKIIQDKIYAETMDLKDGLAIECKVNSQYYVVAFIHYDEEEDEIVFEDVSFRHIDELEKNTWLETQEYCNCIKFAKQALKDAFELKE